MPPIGWRNRRDRHLRCHRVSRLFLPNPAALLAACALALAPAPCAATVAGRCAADCNGDRVVTVDELVRGVRIALQEASVSDCPAADADGDGSVTIADLVGAVAAALGGCPPSPSATPPSTPSTATPATLPTETPLPA